MNNLHALLEWSPAPAALLAPSAAISPIQAWAEEFMFGAFIVLLLGLILLEKRHPLLKPGKRILRGSYYTNLSAFLFNNITLSLCQVPMLYVLASNYASWGLLGHMQEGALKILLAFILLDLTMYVWHFLSHHCDALWVFHKVHHSDFSVNVTTGLRYHLGELFLEALLRGVFIIVAGVDVATLLFCQGIMTLFILLHHSNLRVPGEAWLAKLFIMPSLHRLHHSSLREEHDSNYGAVFTLWDTLFKTLKHGEPRMIGLQGVEEQSFVDLVKYGLTTRIRFQHPNALGYQPLAAQRVAAGRSPTRD
jgi:sterol desaturase/sphingolipid hydroxylase (fatty acid hydroxylase superfamily)